MVQRQDVLQPTQNRRRTTVPLTGHRGEEEEEEDGEGKKEEEEGEGVEKEA